MNTTVLSLTKPTLYREYHCPVTDNLHYTENTTVLLLTKTYIIQRIPLSCHGQKPTLYREYHCPVTDKNLHYTENTIVLSLKNSQEEFKVTKGAIRIRISKNRQNNGQKKMYKRTKNNQQNIHIKLKIE